MIEALRTPDERFQNLPGFPFAPNYLEQASGLRMHYLDEGRWDGPTFLCLHGQPSWSYLYRKMIPVFAGVGRVVAPDLFGFGRSDKPVEEEVYGFDFHRASLLELIDALDLRNMTLVCQDWGGILGLTLPMDRPDRFDRLIFMNTALATGEAPLGPGFEAWRAFNRSQSDLDISALMSRASPVLTKNEAAAYSAPYPDARYKAGVRRFPDLVPDRVDAPGAELARRARRWWSTEWAGQSFMVVGAQDPVLTPTMMEKLRQVIRGCPEPLIVDEAGHFVQEWGEPVANAALHAFDSARDVHFRSPQQ